jgi:hypothetical protein
VCRLFPKSFTNLDNLLEVQLFVRGVSELGERIHCLIFLSFYFTLGWGRRGGERKGGGGGNGGNSVIFFSFFFFSFFLFTSGERVKKRGC